MVQGWQNGDCNGAAFNGSVAWVDGFLTFADISTKPYKVLCFKTGFLKQ